MKPVSPVRNQPSVGDRLARRLGLLVIALEHRGRADQHLAVLGDPHLGTRDYPADGLGVGLAVGLQGGEPGELGGAVDLLEVDAERAKEAEGVGPERRAAGIDPARAPQAELVAHRAVDQDLAERAGPAGRSATGLPSRMALRPLGQPAEILEQPALERGRIGRPDLHLGQHVLPDPRRRQAIVGPSSRRSRCTVSGLSGQLLVNPTRGQHQREQRVADPRHRQIAQQFVADPHLLRGMKPSRGRQQVGVGQHDALGRPVVPEV